LLPDVPSDQKNKGVEAVTGVLVNLLEALQPPINEILLLAWSNKLKTHSPKHMEPNFLAVSAGQQKMVSRFRLLGAKGTAIIVLKTMTPTPFSSPGATKEQQSEKKLASRRSFDNAELFGAVDSALTVEEGTVSPRC
jgi:hypothetical protein